LKKLIYKGKMMETSIKNALFDIKAEVDFILLDVQTTLKMSDEEIKEFSKWVTEINNVIEDLSIDNDIFIDAYRLIAELTDKMLEKKVEINENVVRILITYFKILPEMGGLIEEDSLNVDTVQDLNLNSAVIEELEEMLIEIRETEYAEKDLLAELEAEKEVDNKKREIILFRLNGVKYGVELNKIQEIIVFPEHITRIPSLKEMVLGVINLRGEVTPLIDLRLWFNTQKKESIKYSEEDIIISVKNETGKIIGLVIDEVDDVVVIDMDKLIPVSQDLDIPSTFLKGLLNHGEESRDMIVVLDVDSLLTEATLESLVNKI